MNRREFIGGVAAGVVGSQLPAAIAEVDGSLGIVAVVRNKALTPRQPIANNLGGDSV